MKTILLLVLTTLSANAKWEMFNGGSGSTFIYNTENGMVARYYKNFDENNSISTEGFAPMKYRGILVQCENGQYVGDISVNFDTYDAVLKAESGSAERCFPSKKK